MAKQRDHTTEIQVGGPNVKPDVPPQEECQALNGSQEPTASPTLRLLTYVSQSNAVNDISMEFHMTIQTKVISLTDKQASMLLAVSCYRAVNVGVDFTLYLAMEFLYNRMWRNGRDPLETANEKIRKTLLLSDIILSYIRGAWLTFTDYEKLPQEVIDEILTLGWLPSDRTFNSWKRHWLLERYLKVKIVPVEALLDRSKYSTAERYTGYTKGYGQTGSPAQPGKTKHSSELDGDDSERPPPSFSLQEFNEYQTAIRLIEFAKARRRQQK